MGRADRPGAERGGVPCPSAADSARNPRRTAAEWTLGTVTTILQNPRYTGRQVWNRQRTDTELADPGNVTLRHKSVQRWNLPGGWVISDRQAGCAGVLVDQRMPWASRVPVLPAARVAAQLASSLSPSDAGVSGSAV